LRDAVAPKSPPKQRLAKKLPATKKMPKKKKAKQNTTVVRFVISPKKEDPGGETPASAPGVVVERYHGGTRTLSIGLCGGLKRQAGFAVKWAREVADIQAQIDDLPQGTSCHTETEWKLFDQLVDAKDNAAAWLSKIRLSEHHMRTGAFRSFDINEAIKTSDRRKAEKAAKNTVPDEEELGA
jgi:hypothetical protein